MQFVRSEYVFMRREVRLTSTLAATGLANHDYHAVLFHTIEQFLPMFIYRQSRSL